MHDLSQNLSNLSIIKNERTRSISAENPDGQTGSGGKIAHPSLGPSRKGKPAIRPFKSNSKHTIADIDGPGEIQSIWITTFDKTEYSPYTLRDIILRMYWDKEVEPSVEVPLGDFFCNGFARRAIINSIPIVVNPFGGFNCYFPMPFKSHARITIENQHMADIPFFFYQINYTLKDIEKSQGYFHAKWNRENPTKIKKDYTVIDNINGKGHYIGTYIGLTALDGQWWGEGEMKFFIDDDDAFPTICGTGLEDYAGGAWCFLKDIKKNANPVTYSTPYLGYPYNSAVNDELNGPTMHSLYRWHVPDPIRFTKKLKVTLQQIGSNFDLEEIYERSDDTSSVAYWYQEEPHTPFNKILSKEERWPRQ